MWEVEIGAGIYSLKWCSLHGIIIIVIIKINLFLKDHLNYEDFSLRLYHVLGIHVFQYSGNL
jgi:hypothetical protein